MSSKKHDLHSTADDIESVAGKSLLNQLQLLNVSSAAFKYMLMKKASIVSTCTVSFYTVSESLKGLAISLIEKRKIYQLSGSEMIDKLARFRQHQQEELLPQQEQTWREFDKKTNMVVKTLASVCLAKVHTHV